MLNFIGQWIVSIPGGMTALGVMPYISIVLVLYAIWVFTQHYQVFNRPKVEGVVKKSDLISEFNGGMNKSSMFRFCAELEFEFKFEGKKYSTSKTSSLEFNGSFDAMASEKVRQFPVGKAVAIYVNGKNPNKSIVENLFPYSIYLIGLGAILIYMLHDALIYTINQSAI